MPSKKKGTSQKPAKAKTPTLINGLTVEEMSKEQIEEHLVRLREELDREREERNYFQLERDNVHTFWEISDRKLEVKNSEKDIEDDTERFQEEIRVYKQKMKHLLCEHQNTNSDLKADSLASAELQQKQQNELENMHLKKKRAIMVDMEELDSKNLIRELELELKHTEEMASTRNDLEKQVTELKARYEEKLQLLLQQHENLMKSKILELEFQGNSHISACIEDHCKILSHVNEDEDEYKIAKENIRQIKEMREELREMKDDDKTLSVLEDISSAEIIIKAKEENANIDPIVNHEKALEDLKLDHAVMEQKFSDLQLERDELCKSFTQKIQSMYEAPVGSTLLERKLQVLTDDLENTQAQLHSLLSSPNMDHTGLSLVTNQILENLDFRNSAVKNLENKINMTSEACLLLK